METKVTICGSVSESSLGKMCARGAETLGFNVNYVDTSTGGIPIINRFSHSIDAMRDRLISECVRVDPDIILIIKGENINSKTIQDLKDETNAAVVNWYPDNPFQVRSEPRVSEEYLESLTAYDIIFTWGEFLSERLREHGASRVAHLPFGYDPKLHFQTEPREEYMSDVVFLGHWSKKRERYLKRVAKMDINFDLWGNYWKWRCWNWPLRRSLHGDALFGENYSQAMASAKIVVNVVADHNIPAYNMRTFEIPATGSLMLTTDTKGQRKIFEPDHEVAMYSSEKELCDQIDYYLYNGEERRAIAKRGYEQVQEHSYAQRIGRVLTVANDVTPKFSFK